MYSFIYRISLGVGTTSDDADDAQEENRTGAAGVVKLDVCAVYEALPVVDDPHDLHLGCSVGTHLRRVNPEEPRVSPGDLPVPPSRLARGKKATTDCSFDY